MDNESMDISNLDVKQSIYFLDKVDYEHQVLKPEFIELNTSRIWKITNFLSDNECDLIINNCNSASFEKLNYRKSQRIISFDINNCLINTIQTRLSQHDLPNMIAENKWASPYGFKSNLVTWNKSNIKINPVIRVNKYENNDDFKYHRDASFTSSHLVKSNYTLCIYLNDNFEGGKTEFKINSSKLIHSGITVDEELKFLESDPNNILSISITPKKGMAIIFDQRLLHSGLTVFDTKYVLRTDLICTGIWKLPKINTSPLVDQIEKLTKSLFRQAQYNELNNIESNKLYEICLSLRQYPHLLTKYPNELEKLLINNTVNIPVTSKIKFVERNGNKYNFKFDTNDNNKLQLLKICIIFALLSLTKNIDIQFIDNFKLYLKKLNINYEGNISSIMDNISPYYTKNFELFSNHMISAFTNHARIRGDKRDVFDLIHPVIVSLKQNNNYRADLAFHCYNNEKDVNFKIKTLKNCVKNDDISICATFIKIFNLESFNIKDCNNINPILLPLSILTTFYTCNFTKYTHDCGCATGSRHSNILDIKNKTGIYGANFNFQIGDFIINLYDVLFYETITGKAKINTPGDSFNHASCSCKRSCSLNSSNNKTYITINYDIEFEISESNIFLNIIPKIVL